jgi:hypothetical protein
MSIHEFRSRLDFIKEFIIKMNKETVPTNTQKVIIKIYATHLKLNLTDRMIDDIL